VHFLSLSTPGTPGQVSHLPFVPRFRTDLNPEILAYPVTFTLVTPKKASPTGNVPIVLKPFADDTRIPMKGAKSGFSGGMTHYLVGKSLKKKG
jgi:hypothetical protein